MRARPFDSRFAPAGHRSEGFWNNYWTLLVRAARTDRAVELCLEQRAGAAGGAADASGGPCNASAMLERWCTAQRGAPPPTPSPSPQKPILLLGGDAHYAREVILYRLFSAGVLDKARWSLSTPAQCSERGQRESPTNQLPQPLSAAGRAAWRPFCAQFAGGPKRVDIDLSGPLEASSKDQSFPPASLYAQTRFSLVFESVVSAPGDEPDYPAFLTEKVRARALPPPRMRVLHTALTPARRPRRLAEKVLKPLYRGHPFLLMCHTPATWPILHALGFRSFEPTMDDGPFDNFSAMGGGAGAPEFPCDYAKTDPNAFDGGEFARQLLEKVQRLLALPDAAWAPALSAAAHNRRHVVCADGLSAKLRTLAKNVLRFALTGTRAAAAAAAGSAALAARRATRPDVAEAARARRPSPAGRGAPGPLGRAAGPERAFGGAAVDEEDGGAEGGSAFASAAELSAAFAARPGSPSPFAAQGAASPSPATAREPRAAAREAPATAREVPVSDPDHLARPQAATREPPAREPPAASCEYWCNVTCTQLHGDVQRECGGCPDSQPCHRGADGFGDWRVRAERWEAAHTHWGGGGRGGGGGGGGGKGGSGKGGGRRRAGGGSGRGGGRGGGWRARDVAMELPPPPPPPSLGADVKATLSAFATEHSARATALRTSGAPSLADLSEKVRVATAASVAPGSQALCAHRTRLPVLARFCRRSAQQCAPVDEVLREALAPSVPSAPDTTVPITALAPLVHVEMGRKGAGFGAVMQEKANLLLLGLVTRRPVMYYASADAFNAGHELLGATSLGGSAGPGGAARAVERPSDGLVGGVGYTSARECSIALASQRLALPWRCNPYAPARLHSADGAAAQWVPALHDGEAENFIKGPASTIWDRWKHRIKRPIEAGELFPNRSAIAFLSPSITNAFLNDFVRGLPLPAPLDAPSRSRVELLARGSGEFNGPNCLVRQLTRRASKAVLRSLLSTLSPTAVASCADDDAAECSGVKGGALLVGLHLRRGDKAMMKECRECINLDDPDVQETSTDRIELGHFLEGLAAVNRTVARLRTAIGREVMVFVASDTVQGLHLARAALGAHTPLLTVGGFAVHSTRTLHTATPDGVKVITDLLAMAISDVLLAVGQSSFSGLAGAIHAGVRRVGEQAVGGEVEFEEAEMTALRESFGRAA